jgi:hypothetical protein
MIDLRSDIIDLQRALMQVLEPAKSEGGRTVMFMSATRGEGASSVAASFALLAAEASRRPAWLIDLDLKRNNAFNTFAVGAFARAFGGVGPPYSAALKTQPFFTIELDDPTASNGLGLFTAHRVGDTRLMVTQFDAARLLAGQSIRIRAQPAYWAAVRAATDWAVVDSPSLDRASAGLAIASQMDAVILVVRADHAEAADVEALRQRVQAHGGKVVGVVLNRMRADALLADRFVH